MRWKTWMAYGLSLVLLSGCGWLGPNKASAPGSGQKVVVVSALGDRMHSTKLATFSTNHVTDARQVPQWQLDAALRDSLGEFLAARTGWQVVAAEYDAAALNSALQQDAGGFSAFAGIRSAKAPLNDIAKRTGADYLLVIRPAHVLDDQFASAHVFNNYGVVYRSVNGVKREAIYLAVTVGLLQADSLQAVSGAKRMLALQPLPSGFYRAQATNYSEDDLQKIRDSVQQLGEQVVLDGLSLARGDQAGGAAL